MNKERIIIILISLSTVLKICSVVALCAVNMHPEDHGHHYFALQQRKGVQTSHELA